MSATTMGAVPADPPAVSRQKFFGFMVMVLGMFMAILDIQIVSASISDIQAGLAASPDEASWIQTSYLIAEIVMIPLSGFLSRLLSTRVLFTISALGFTAFSLLCAMATSLGTMIFCRAMQGFLGGAMIPTVFATAFILFPGKQRIRISVLIGLTATLAPTIGPTLGGMLTETFSWHWLFLINVPFGLLVAGVVWSVMDIDRGDRSLLARFDWWGLAFMALFLGSVEYVMEEGPRWEWLQDSGVATFAFIGTVAGVLFFWRAFTSPEPIVELRAYADRNFAIGSLFAFLVGIGLYGSVYLIPLFLGRIRGFNSLQIGETMFITGLCMFFAAPLVGQMTQRLNVRLVLAIGLFLMALAAWLTATLTSQSGFPQLAFALGLRGVGTMMVMVPVNQVALGTLPPARLKNASGLYNLMRNLGGAVGLAMINELVTERGAAHGQHLAEAASSGRLAATQWLQGVTAALTPQLGAPQAQLAALKRLQGLVDQQALVLAYNDVLVVMAALFFLGMPLVFLLRRPRAGAGGDAH
ncbi:MAG TPA: DHA2 family efflux MFS transporter permease subunit [Roseomonas sp.]|jgi:DHA2 family multidrug resistance protein